MTTVEKSVDVKVPVQTAYNQWTQFESFPHFMAGVEEIRQVTPTRTHWVTKIGGVRREFDTEITEQHPDERVAWRSLDRPSHGGVVTFHRMSADTTRVHLQMEYHPDTLVEKVGTAVGSVQHRIEGDLERFKKFIETRGQETGAWRGDVASPPQTGQTGQPQSPRTGQPESSQPRPPQSSQPRPPQSSQPRPPQSSQPRPPQSGQTSGSAYSAERRAERDEPRAYTEERQPDTDERRAPRGGTSSSSVPPTGSDR